MRTQNQIRDPIVFLSPFSDYSLRKIMQTLQQIKYSLFWGLFINPSPCFLFYLPVESFLSFSH